MCNDPFSIKQEPEKVIWWNKYIRGETVNRCSPGREWILDSDHIFEIKDITV